MQLGERQVDRACHSSQYRNGERERETDGWTSWLTDSLTGKQDLLMEFVANSLTHSLSHKRVHRRGKNEMKVAR